MSTPDLHLNTLFVLDPQGRITSTREPGPSPGPLFSLVRSATRCAWAVRADVPEGIANGLEELAREEPPVQDLRNPPHYANRYVALLEQQGRAKVTLSGGPAFAFPGTVTQPTDVVVVEDERLLNHRFRGWVPGEIAAGRLPVMAVIQDGYPASVCFSARRSDEAAEAGVETAEEYRGRGLGPRVTAAWALAVRASGRIPLFSTSWTNTASLAIARKLGLIAYASSWSLQ